MSKPSIDLLPTSALINEDGSPLLIAGPCSAESEEQVLQTAHLIKNNVPGVTVYRAGVWKPRTRPNSFEGVGIPALKWLKRVKQETGLKVAVEVANTQHVYESLKAGIDILWIGARTTVNPFTVQEIADALRGVDIPVLVKNPVNPDLQLWLGAIERLNQAGIRQLGGIHRGFSTFDNAPYRNQPKWNSAIEFKRLVPELPLICDPSHIAGRRDLLQPIAQKAMDLAMDGLMIETHIDPSVALSDASQQVTPADLHKLLSSIRFTKEDADGEDHHLLEDMRRNIDQVDKELIEVLARRTRLSRTIGQYKKDHNMTILQVKRWDQMLEDILNKGINEGLDEKFVRAIFQTIHTNSINIQTEIVNGKVEA
ncbi:chorismate mutase [Adhaeribacter aquaticus]|uniref:chorismate mutase n=1 Tax=Adhaeribacter aquaticus TaxID=299567 RepID=UPI00041D4E01|nr:chorismate mutase [Adhaeribacter aquaticus]